MALQRFKNRPVEVRAVQYDGTERSADEIISAFPGFVLKNWPEGVQVEGGKLVVQTPSLGRGAYVLANPGDWIVEGIDLVIFPNDPITFARAYELIE